MRMHGLRRQGSITLLEVLLFLAIIQGAICGAVWGWMHHGWVGALLGIPGGALVGLLGFYLFFLLLFVIGTLIVVGCALLQRGLRVLQ